MMIRSALAALATAALLVAAPAQADEPPMLLLSSRVVCVKPDFPVTGSGWKVHAAIAAWNEAQRVIRLTATAEPGCVTVYVHRYSAQDGRCAYTAWDRTWPWARLAADGVTWLVDGADVYLNDLCGPGFSKLWSRWTLAHELGHAMGLPHIASTRSVMTTEPVLNPYEPLIGAIDVRHLQTLYR